MQPKYTWSRKDVGSPKSTYIGSRFCFFRANLCHPHTQKRIVLFHDVQRDILNLEFSPQPCFNRIFSICLSHNSPVKGWPYRFLSRRTTGSSILDHDLGHLCRGRRIQMSGHSDLGFFNNLWASSIFDLRKSGYCICCLSCASWQSWNIVHDLCGCHLWW